MCAFKKKHLKKACHNPASEKRPFLGLKGFLDFKIKFL
jgi:hypothetical protein